MIGKIIESIKKMFAKPPKEKIVKRSYEYIDEMRLSYYDSAFDADYINNYINGRSFSGRKVFIIKIRVNQKPTYYHVPREFETTRYLSFVILKEIINNLRQSI